ncbi:hypothetical protein OIU79_004305 [Salix purpurea]|uniref:THH1/TOM1/TOM3 domain-containing protein n=2 Tax=Salix TaxID=40685 RepID=A0A9Q0U9U6_SALPP|nr:hypothetical protein OIU79_004305 [Salix purpurea]
MTLTYIKQARAVSTDGLRPSFFTINAVVYAIQVKFLLHFFTINRNEGEDSKSNTFFMEASQLHRRRDIYCNIWQFFLLHSANCFECYRRVLIKDKPLIRNILKMTPHSNFVNT